MIGVKLTRRSDGSAWTVVGQHGSGWVVAPSEHGESPYAVPASVLAADFDTADAVSEPQAVDEVAAWQQLGARFRENIARAARPAPVTTMTPEEALTDPEGVAERIAQQIAADPDTLAEVEAGIRRVHPAVERELDRIATERKPRGRKH